MAPQKYQLLRLSRDPEVQSLLDETVEVLASSRISLRESSESLIRAERDNDQQRKQLAESRRLIALRSP